MAIRCTPSILIQVSIPHPYFRAKLGVGPSLICVVQRPARSVSPPTKVPPQAESPKPKVSILPSILRSRLRGQRYRYLNPYKTSYEVGGGTKVSATAVLPISRVIPLGKDPKV